MGQVVLVALLLAVTGCRLDVVVEVTVEPEGSGLVALAFHLDEALLDELDAIGVDPAAEVTAVAMDDEDWQLERVADDHEVVVTLRRHVADSAAIGDSLRELSAALASDDPALLVDIDVEVADDGGSTVTGTAGFRPPATVGAQIDGEPFGPAGDELAAIVERSVVPVLVVTLPGPVTSTDADHLDGRTARWELPVADQRAISAQADPPPWWSQHSQWLLAAGVAAAVLALAVLVWWAVRRRRRRARGSLDSA